MYGMDALKPQDVVVVLKLCVVCTEDAEPSIANLAMQLGISSSEAHGAMRRARNSGLLRASASGDAAAASFRATPGRIADGPMRVRLRRNSRDRPNVTAILEFLVHGLKYAFPSKRGEVTRGMPTAYAAPPLRDLIVQGADLIPVWPDPAGSVRGIAFEPLYPSVPFAAAQDPLLYELLALADALRDGRVREKKIAEAELRKRLRRSGAR